jgi:hypothetical protein
MPEPDVTVRPIDFARDTAPLTAFLGERDRMRLEHAEAAVHAGDCFIYVADADGAAVGWAVVHTNFRDDQDWDPPDADTVAFQQGDNAYLEQIEVTAGKRRSGQAAGGGAGRGETARQEVPVVAYGREQCPGARAVRPRRVDARAERDPGVEAQRPHADLQKGALRWEARLYVSWQWSPCCSSS